MWYAADIFGARICAVAALVDSHRPESGLA